LPWTLPESCVKSYSSRNVSSSFVFSFSLIVNSLSPQHQSSTDHASLVFALSVRNHHVGAARRCAKRQIAIFIERVVRIVIGQRIGIAENGGGFMKGDAMLGEVADSPPRVPLEFRYLSLD
jgi:hypothetical protein